MTDAQLLGLIAAALLMRLTLGIGLAVCHRRHRDGHGGDEGGVTVRDPVLLIR